MTYSMAVARRALTEDQKIEGQGHMVANAVTVARFLRVMLLHGGVRDTARHVCLGF